MNTEQIREIVRVTIDELIQSKLIYVDKYQYILKIVDKRLYDFFDGKDGNGISLALKSVCTDEYIDIIYFQYRDRKTIEWIAEYFEKDVSTIKRNKKRLITSIYEALEVYKRV